MTSIFQKTEDAAIAAGKEIEQDVEAAFEAAWDEVKHLWTADVEPIVKATLLYVEKNGGADLLLLAQAGVAAAGSTISGGSSAAAVGAAVVGTVIDQAKSFGLQIEHGAAALAVNMAAAEINTAVPVIPAPAPEVAAPATAPAVEAPLADATPPAA